MTEPQYIAYFENLATQLVAIQHSAERKAFYVVHDDNYTELETAIRNNLNLPALLLDQYFDEINTEHDNNRLQVLGGFTIICKTEAGNAASLRESRAEARRLARIILSRIRKDCRFGGVLYNQTISVSFQFQGEPVAVLAGGTATGWGYAVTFLLPTSVAENGDDWLD